MNKVNWTAVAIFGIVMLLVFLVSVSLLGGWGGSSWGRMGPGMMGQGMMGGLGFGPLGWIGMIFMWLIPVGVLVLAGVGIVWLVRAIGGTGKATTPSPACPNCGRNVLSDWRNCPFCGKTL